MRSLLTSALSVALTALTASPLLAQEGEKVDLLSPNAGVMFWTLIIFVVLLFVLSRYAFKPLTAAVEAREKHLEEMIQSAKADREEAARFLEEQKKVLDAARADAQRVVAESRITAEKLRAEMIEQTKQQQRELLDRARGEIENERKRAITDLRREAVDLALAGASKLVERNLDDQTNRKLVESFLASVPVRGNGRGQR
ncbi:MAG TPA: F0F1 ATP synthase subunit B [Gemmatimonadaceae bacterium]|nr:F0F1 ATP synthase subunit B [Gemmatimonadaceae bacterium]